MAQKAGTQSHAVYDPRPALPRPTRRSQATPTGVAPHSRGRRNARAANATRGDGRQAAPAKPLLVVLGAGIGVLLAGALFALLVLRIYAVLAQLPHASSGARAFPLLLGATILILVRGQVGIDRYRAMQRRLGLVSGGWSDHALGLLYVLTLFFVVCVVAALLAWGAAMLVAALAG